ncbi:MAG: hypothetical protein KKD63_02105 [Proteobacteria bacterium]|nr:hypothetical protein [Desulfobulbaceae bacterium]MBU4151654.1 hypothetical protein [Pseudomonadota bacterium]MDP2105315.1 hypothetical protein [Desulfobulbaceae bacterium]
MLKVTKGALVEYGLSLPPLALIFDFNPQTLSRTRTIQLRTGSAPGTRGGYDFMLPTETPRVAQGVTVLPESVTIDILIDATDRLMAGEAGAEQFGIEPELDTLRTMVEPKSQGPGGMQTLASLGLGTGRAFQRDQSASVQLFVWGSHILPVFLTSIRVDESAHLPSLVPYRANVQLSMQVIEGNNPFYKVEKMRQAISAAINSGRTIGAALGGLI